MLRLGEIARTVVHDAGRRSLSYWFDQATNPDPATALAAFREANGIRQQVGLAWDRLAEGREAA